MSESSGEAFERLGAFYLGREIPEPDGDASAIPVLYDSKDLTTHAVIVGMTGSGKTGLAVGILEEASIDGIPSIAIDVKGDLTNLLLTFPELRASDFRPWIDEGEAARTGQTPDELAEATASLWKSGLAKWGQNPARIKRLRDSVEIRLLTPGSSRGVPMSLLASLGKPSDSTDPETQRSQILGAVSGLLTLLGVDADPIKSREHIFLSNILAWAWSHGQEWSLADLIRAVQKPPFDSVGVIDLESFYPERDRHSLAMTINNLLASPSFQSWREGEPLSIPDLLYGKDGKPRQSVLYIAHLSETERMFFVTRLLNEVVAWMRTQSGTGSLRALIYMDEVFGYLPPTANPPSKRPLLTLLKQARAYGVGVILATQNPVDLDYKALSNAGTWLLGRLQTERDKLRVLDGLEGASGGGSFDRSEVDAILSGLGKRRFLLHNVHEDGPVLFQTRWVMSYLAGPLTLDQASRLARSNAGSVTPAEVAETPQPQRARPAAGPSTTSSAARPSVTSSAARPILPSGVDEVFIEDPDARAFLEHPGGEEYAAGLFLSARLHFVRANLGVDVWKDVRLLGAPGRAAPRAGGLAAQAVVVGDRAGADSTFLEPPPETKRKGSYRSWGASAKAYLYRSHRLTVFRSKHLDAISQPDESEVAFRARLRHKSRELRDVQLEKLRRKYDVKIDRLQKRIEGAEERVAREESQYQEQRMSSVLDIGATLLGSFLGRKRVSRSTLSGATRAARRLSRASKEKEDIGWAKDKLAGLVDDMRELEDELRSDLGDVRDSFDPDLIQLEEVELPPRKSDIQVVRLALAWVRD